MVLNYFPGNTGDIRRLPCKHVDIRPQESNERAFLFVVKGGTYGESSSRPVLLGGHLLRLRWSSLGLLAGRGLRHVLNGSAVLRRGALAGVGAGGLAGLPLFLAGILSGRSVRLGGGRCNCFPVHLVGADDGIFLVGVDSDDAHRTGHL